MRNKSYWSEVYILVSSGVRNLLDGFISVEGRILVGLYKIYIAMGIARWVSSATHSPEYRKLLR